MSSASAQPSVAAGSDPAAPGVAVIDSGSPMADPPLRALPLDDPARLAALRSTGLLDTLPEPSFDRLTRLAAALMRVPVTMVTLVDSDRQFYKSSLGMPGNLRETPLSYSLCQHVVVLAQPLFIEDARVHPLVRENRAVTELGAVAYAGIPLTTHSGLVIGTLCAIDLQPRHWTAEEMQGLRDLAAAAMTEVELRQRMRDAAEAGAAAARQSREHQALLDATAEGLYGIDFEGRCTFINKAGAAALGWTPAELLGRNMHALIHHTRGDGTPYAEADCPVVQAGELGRASAAAGSASPAPLSNAAGAADAAGDSHCELFWRRDGSSFMARFASHPVLVAGRLTGTLVSFTDVSESLRTARRLAVQHAVSGVLAEAADIESAVPRLLDAIGHSLDWVVGAYWKIGERSGRLRCRDTWQLQPDAGSVFLAATRALLLGRGEGLPGQVWASGSAHWITDLALDPHFARQPQAQAEGLRVGFAFPIRAAGEVLGVIEFFSRAPQAPDDDLLRAGATIGNQIGQFMRRKKAEGALLLAERALTSSGVGVTMSDARKPDLPIVYVNPAFTAMTGYAADEVLGRNCRLLQGEHTDAAALAQIREALRAQTDCRVTLLNYRRDGTPFWNELGISPVRDAAGQLTHFVGIQEDVTEERAALEGIRERDHLVQGIFQAVSAQVAVLDRRGRVAYVSHSWTRFAAENPGDTSRAPVGTDYLAVCRKAAERSAHGVRIDEGLRAVTEGRSMRFSFEYPAHTPCEERWFEMHVEPMPREHGGAVVMHVNTTDRKHIEDALNEARLAAESASKAKGQFLANMSHELRTPLNAVILYSELLQEDAEDLGAHQLVPDLQKIRNAGRHLLSLINNVLDLSKIEAGKMDLFLETFDVGAMVTEVVDTIAPLLTKRQNRLDVRQEPGLGSMHADLTKVRQTLYNLLSNATKFTQQGLVVLAARREQVAGDDQVVFEVTDSGIGMTEQQIANLFQPFTQADASTTREYGGTGLGLDISRRFFRAMGGDVTVRSAPGRGSTFIARLPAQVRSGAAVPALGASAANRDEVAPMLLVIDDDASVRLLLTRLLEKEGYAVATAADAESGLRLASQLRPALITLNLAMPEADGWGVLAALKADAALAEIPIYLLSVDENRPQGFALGASEYLTKPIDRTRLASLLKKHAPKTATRTALVVEDDALSRELLAGLLTQEGWTVRVAGDGLSALEALARESAQLIMLDLVMPGMDGFAVLEQLRRDARWRTIPVIVVTALDISAADRARLAGGVSGLAQKGSFGFSDLISDIKRIVGVPPVRGDREGCGG